MTRTAIIEEIKARLARGKYASAHDYYQDRDLLRELIAAAQNKSPREIDPMGHWFGMQSN